MRNAVRQQTNYIRSKLPRLDYINAPDLDGEATRIAHRLATLVLKQHKKNENATQPFGFVVGGETTVALDMSNLWGGRSQELALAFALNMRDADLLAPQQWAIIAAGTDGRDGPTDAAGGFLTSEQGFDKGAACWLSQHNNYVYLLANDQLLEVGATGTNLAGSSLSDVIFKIKKHS